VLVRPGIYADDTGNPGQKSGSVHLSETRKSWTAVIVPPSAANDCGIVMDTLLRGVATDYGTNELHFTDVYSGRGVWKRISLEKRIEIFQLKALFLSKRAPQPIIHVTTSQETLSDHPMIMEALHFDPKQFWRVNVPHLGFLRMCSEVARFVRKRREDGDQDFVGVFPMFADAGLALAGASVKLLNWDDFIEGPSVNFVDSCHSAGVQMADFAAFTISRTQWIVARKELGSPLSRADREFLGYGSGLNVVNLPKVAFSEDSISRQSLDFLLERDRLAKGLPKNQESRCQNFWPLWDPAACSPSQRAFGAFAYECAS